MISTHTLSNGLRIAVDEMPELKTASIVVRVNAGTRNEKEEENGENKEKDREKRQESALLIDR